MAMERRRAAAGSAAFFVAAPGVMGGLVPWWITRWRVASPAPWWDPLRPIGVAVGALGALVLLQAFVRFVVEGRGTPAPVAPTERLVVGGAYRHVRNPMYLAVLAVIAGQALALGQPALLAWAAAFWLTTSAFVVGYEEPALRRRFGAEYEAYRRAVPRWWPRLRPWEPPGG
jgi:protein-S-isoprenylcysteine O-methyltransferase Ste14